MKVDSRSIWAAGAFGAFVALAANLVVYLVGVLAGVGFLSTAGTTAGQTITAGTVTIMSVLWMVTGTAFAWLLNRWGWLRAAQILGAVYAVLSLGFLVPAGFDAGSAAFLAVMHLISGAVYVIALQQAIRRGSGAGTGERQPSEAVS